MQLTHVWGVCISSELLSSPDPLFPCDPLFMLDLGIILKWVRIAARQVGVSVLLSASLSCFLLPLSSPSLMSQLPPLVETGSWDVVKTRSRIGERRQGTKLGRSHGWICLSAGLTLKCPLPRSPTHTLRGTPQDWKAQVYVLPRVCEALVKKKTTLIVLQRTQFNLLNTNV